MSINSIFADDINRLKSNNLVSLLRQLLINEVNSHYTEEEVVKISVPDQITIPDGGEDGRVELQIGDEYGIRSRWIQNGFTCFQCKATQFSNTIAYKEVLRPFRGKNAKREVKQAVLDCISKNGEYVVFTTDHLVDSDIKERIGKIREALRDAGVANPEQLRIRVLDSNQISIWVNSFISSVTSVQRWLGIFRPSCFVTWGEWKELFLSIKKYDYQETELLKDHANQLFSKIAKNKIARVVGHKGIGKTRFILEAFNPENENSYIKSLCESIVYIDLDENSPQTITQFLISHNNIEGVIVVDNCSDEWHNSFAAHVNAAKKIKLITINDSLPKFSEEEIYLERIGQRDAVRMIFKNCFPKLSDHNIEHLLAITEGFPEMVHFVEKALKENGPGIVFETIPEKFIDKFLFGDQESSKHDKELLKACSLFKHFRFYDDKLAEVLDDHEKAKIKNQIQVITNKMSKDASTEAKFYDFCIRFRDKRKLLEKRGVYHSVIPEPIAVNLAADWWETTSFEYVSTVLEDLEQSELLIPLFERLNTLDQIERAQSLVAKVWGPFGPFSTADILNTKLGSRIFRSIVDVNPEMTAKGLWASFGEADNEQLMNVIDGRRNLIWSLERLVFRQESFELAARLLFRFAVTENENVGNNATNQFLQLFHIYLPGTEVDLSERKKIIEWALTFNGENEIRLVISALEECLNGSNFTRSGGAEKQGFATFLKDYEPQEIKEIVDYWNWALTCLKNISINSDSSYSNIARKALIKQTRSLFSNRMSKVLIPILEDVFIDNNSDWEDILHVLYKTREYDRNRLEDFELNEIDRLILKFTPTDFEQRIKFIVTRPPINPVAELKERRPGSVTREMIFADEINEKGIDIEPFLPALLRGEQRYSHSFARRLASGIDFFAVEKLIHASLQQIKSIPINDRNPLFIGGLMFDLPDRTKRSVVKKVIADDNLNIHAFSLVRYSNPPFEIYWDLLELVRTGKESILRFLDFKYGSNIMNLSEQEMLTLLPEIELFGKEGRYTAVQLAFIYIEFHKIDVLKLEHYTYLLVSKFNFLLDTEMLRTMELYQWSIFVSKKLEAQNDVDFAKSISQQINEASMRESISGFDEEIAGVCKILINQYFHLFWDAISKTFLDDTIGYFHLKHLLGTKNGAYAQEGLLFSGTEESYDILVEWAKSNTPNGPRRLAYLMPIIRNSNDSKGWHRFAIKMIDTFGEIDGFLNEIAANMGSFSMIGSAAGYYQMLKDLVDQLKEHTSSVVRNWAWKSSNYYKRMIERERLNDEQWFLK